MKLDFYGIKSNQILYINHRRVIIVTLYGVRSYHTFIVCVTMYQIKLRLNLNILYIYIIETTFKYRISKTLGLTK